MMVNFWNSLSVKRKIFTLVILPVLLIVYLAARQVNTLNMQLSNLEKVEELVLFSQVLSDLQSQANTARLSDAPVNTTPQYDALIKLSNTLFSDAELQHLQGLISDYQESITSLSEAADVEEKNEIVEWQVDTYKQILLLLEKAPYSGTLAAVDGHITALAQLEWLMFWADEENWQIQQLITTEERKDEIKDEIRSLTLSQQLFVERFVAINADPQQVALLLETFSNIAFEQSSEFRSVLLATDQISASNESEIDIGLSALALRLNLLQSVADSIEIQLRDEISGLVATFEQTRAVFFAGISLLTALVILTGVNLAHRVIKNLNLVLKYLEGDEQEQKTSLSARVRGNDELSRFAQEVERLTLERQESQKRLLEAKEDAEQAKENAIEASKAKSSFLANMSHEIRTPLNGVIGISEVLSDTDLTATQKDYVDTIETSSHLLLSLINDILDFSKIESGMLQINPHSTSIRETIYDIASIVAPKVKEKGIQLNVDIDSTIPFRVLADDHRMRQVLMNFMSNAVKFTSEGTVTIGVHQLEEQDNVVSLVFEVIDSGIGIDEARQANIFEAFAQEDDSTTRQFGGTGLGLAISTQLIELMGGKIELDSEKGKGSRFYFKLDLPIDERHYQHRHELKYDELVMVCEDKVYEERIRRDLDFYNIDITSVSSNIEAVHSKLSDKKTVIIYVEGGDVSSKRDETYFSQLNSGASAICLIRQFESTNKDFGRNISALITYPLLGSRLLKSIESCCKVLEKGEIVIQKEQINAGSVQVLLVEDNLVNQKVASLHLKKLGYGFDIANNGLEAVEHYKSGKNYSVVLMDCMMPVMDGFTATAVIREYESTAGLPKTPIIALTASVVDDDIQKCFDAGMDDYVPKPFKADILKQKLVSAVEVKLENIANVKAMEIEGKSTDATSSESSSQSGDEPAVRVLLVEDNMVNQKVASLHLKKAGYDYVIANDGQQALETFQSDSNFDVILMDCMMPVKDGFAATKDIRDYEKQEGMTPTPIIALTASVVDDDIQKCFDAGMDAYVPKPVRREKLFHEMRNLI
ncbi:response regulator [Vibrio methylphosphonaticus]|nr:response regulator [Vibrio methylphosphonaticus]MCL9777209.1 response regulator [Vibrio methylphosphonaticus]